MAKEVERKFLISDKTIVESLTDGENIIQGYLSDNPDATVRIRIKGSKAFLTVKSRNVGAVRGEWEYEIPIEDARSIMAECQMTGLISKTRYRIGRWEIDVFHGSLSGLIIAEIELTSPEERISLPSYIGREVTNDKRYYNSVLATLDPKAIRFE